MSCISIIWTPHALSLTVLKPTLVIGYSTVKWLGDWAAVMWKPHSQQIVGTSWVDQYVTLLMCRSSVNPFNAYCFYSDVLLLMCRIVANPIYPQQYHCIG